MCLVMYYIHPNVCWLDSQLLCLTQQDMFVGSNYGLPANADQYGAEVLGNLQKDEIQQDQYTGYGGFHNW